MAARLQAVLELPPGSESGVVQASGHADAVHPGASATNRFARRLEQAGRRRLARVSKVASAMLLQWAGAGALSVLRALDPSTPSGAFVGPARFGQRRGRPELLEI